MSQVLPVQSTPVAKPRKNGSTRKSSRDHDQVINLAKPMKPKPRKSGSTRNSKDQAANIAKAMKPARTKAKRIEKIRKWLSAGTTKIFHCKNPEMEGSVQNNE